MNTKEVNMNEETETEYEPCSEVGQQVRWERRYARQQRDQDRLDDLLVRW